MIREAIRTTIRMNIANIIVESDFQVTSIMGNVISPNRFLTRSISRNIENIRFSYNIRTANNLAHGVVRKAILSLVKM